MRLDFLYPALVFDADENLINSNTKTLKSLDSLGDKSADSNMRTHMERPLTIHVRKGLKMELVYHPASMRLFAKFSLYIVEDLPPEILDELIDYVHGQMTDGYGEGGFYPQRKDVGRIGIDDSEAISPIYVDDGTKVKPPGPSQRLLWAAEDGDLDYINESISRKRKLDVKGKWNTTPLLLAVRENHVECVEALLKAGADPNSPIYDLPGSHYPIDFNARAGTKLAAGEVVDDPRALPITRLLLNHGANINQSLRNDFEVPLGWAINRGNYTHIEFFLQSGANPNHQRKHLQKTLLMARHFDTRLAKLFIKYGYDLSLKNENGETTYDFFVNMAREFEQQEIQAKAEHNAITIFTIGPPPKPYYSFEKPLTPDEFLMREKAKAKEKWQDKEMEKKKCLKMAEATKL